MSSIVFHGNKAEADDEAAGGTGRADDFRDRCRQGNLEHWSCVSLSRAGDLYLFWFGAPVSAILGLGTVSAPPYWQRNTRNRFAWTSRARVCFAAFGDCILLDTPLDRQALRANRTLASWWEGRPWRGTGRELSPGVARAIRDTLARTNRRQSGAIRKAFDRCLDSKRESATSETLSVPLGGIAPAERERVRASIERFVRDAKLRGAVLDQWGRACAACGLSIAGPGDDEHEVEVAHVVEVREEGTDAPSNALPLCRLHHWAFDVGIWAFSPQGRMHGRALWRADPSFRSMHGQPLRAANGRSPKGLLDEVCVKARWRRFQR